MQINQMIETTDGAVQFQAELNPEQVQFIMSVGINYLMGVGALQVKKEGLPKVDTETVEQSIIIEH